jgi:hypothetical protein
MNPEYLAGLFDGEGCIDVQRMYPKTGRNRLYVRPRVRMCMADNARSLAQMLHATFGGHLASRKAGKRNQQNSWSLEWLSNDEIRRILGLILPHLILKAEQARLVFWWLDNASGRQVKNTRFGQNAYFAGMEQARAAFAEELRAMKMDPQRLSERAVQRISVLMRQSDHHGDMVKVGETATSLA